MPSRKTTVATRTIARKSKATTTVVARKKKRTSAAPQPARASAASSSGLYSVHPGVAMIQKWIAELKGKTGRTFEEWLRHIKSAGPADEKSCREWLKTAHGFGTNTAWWLAEKALGNPMGMAEDSPEDYLAACPVYVDRMYSGPRAHLRELHDELVRLAKGLGNDVRVCPCTTIVPLYRRHVFAEIKPASHKRIDLGFALGDEPFTDRLLDTGGRLKKNRITHRVALTSLSDLDLQVKRWLREAYERDG
jgi:hypothetical protein